MNCIYCNQEIIIPSKEHIIQNAIGGTLESDKICCANCNNILSKIIDKPFTDMFNAIVMHLPDFQKTNNKDSKNIIFAKGITYNNEQYDIIVKNKKITSCPDLQKKLKKNYDKSIFVAYNYELFKITDNNIFLSGIRKIAFNFAVHYFYNKNIPIDILLSGISVIKKSEKELDISYTQLTIPYYAITTFDTFIEKQDTAIYHNLLLFSFDNKLWCYVGLFNTFKYYVCLSNNCNFSINESYSQYVRKVCHDISFVNYHRLKDKLILAQEFDVDAKLEDSEFKKQVCTRIQKMNNKFDYYSYMNDLCTNIIFLYTCIKKDEKFLKYYSFWFNYFTDEINHDSNEYEENIPERYINKNYKETVLLSNGQEIAYPDFLYNFYDEKLCKQYCTEQLEKLASYIKQDKSEGE
jgi:hypothetical protein